MKKSSLLSVLAFFSIIISLSAQSGVSINNGKLFFSALPGEQETIDVLLTNPNPEEIILQAFFKDWYRDSLGQKIYQEPGTLGTSCAEWVSVEPVNIVVPSEGNAVARVKMDVPVDYDILEGVKNTMLFVKQIKDPSKGGENQQALKSSMEVVFQIGIHIYYSHPGLTKKGMEIKSFSMNPADPNKQITLALENTGEVITEGFIQIEFTNQETGQEYRILDQALGANFLPEDYRNFYFRLPENLPSGKYTAMAIVDIGSDEELILGVKDFEFEAN
ncbi:MAG: hypothetical protein R2879_03500 [Saprospiraceae bacterium]